MDFRLDLRSLSVTEELQGNSSFGADNDQYDVPSFLLPDTLLMDGTDVKPVEPTREPGF